MRNSLVAVVMLIGLAASAEAQIVRADRITLNTGPCTERAGTGSPEGVQVGIPCDSWRDDTTGLVYQKVTGTGNTGWRRLVGPTGATCTTFAGCVAATLDMDTLTFTQKLRTDESYKFRQSVTTGGTRLESFNGGGWMPLKLSGGPTQVVGGGFHVGQSITSDPGVGNSDFDGYVGVPGYASRTTGWRIAADGSADLRSMFVDELHAKAFIADLEQALAGGQIITKSVAVVGEPFTVPAAGAAATLWVQDLPSAAGMAVFQSGDTVLLRSFSRSDGGLIVGNAVGVVTSYADGPDGLQSWTFTRNSGANAGTLSAGTIVAADGVALDFGTSGSGYYEVTAIDGTVTASSITRSGSTATLTSSSPHGYQTSDVVRIFGADQTEYNGAFTVTVTGATTLTYAVSGTPATPATGTILTSGTNGTNAPYAQIVTWATSPIAANLTLRTRFGNLRGVTGVAEYGLLAGTYAASDGRYFKASDQGFALHGIDISLWDGATRVLYVDSATPYWSMGVPAPTAYGSGTGCWQGMDGGAFKWRCGNPSGSQYVQWDGTNLTVGGNILLPNVANPSGSGLFLGSDFLGYYASGAWKTYMDNTGKFYLGGTSGSLQWNGTALVITAQLAGNGSGITSIDGANITTGTVTATQIAALTITAAQIAAGTITAAKIAALTITAAELAADSVTSAKILAGTIVASDIAAATITGGNIAATTIAAGNIVSGTITAAQIAASTITAANMNVANLASISASLGTITAGTVTLGSAGYVRQGQTAYNTGTGFWLGDDSGTPKFSIGNPSGNRLTFDGSTLTYVGVGSGLTALDGGNVQAATLVNAALVDDTITGSKIAAGTITASEISAGTITADKMNVSNLAAITADLGTITAGSVTLGSAGYVRQGQTAYNTGTGFWLGDVSGTAKFSIGSSSGNYMTWDGTELKIVGRYVPESASYATLGNGGNTATTYTPTLFLTKATAANYDRICVVGDSGSGDCNDAGDYVTGTQITVIVTGAGTVTVRHLESIGGSTNNGFICPGAVDFTRATTESFTASYDGTRWVVTSKS